MACPASAYDALLLETSRPACITHCAVSSASVPCQSKGPYRPTSCDRPCQWLCSAQMPGCRSPVSNSLELHRRRRTCKGCNTSWPIDAIRGSTVESTHISKTGALGHKMHLCGIYVFCQAVWGDPGCLCTGLWEVTGEYRITRNGPRDSEGERAGLEEADGFQALTLPSPFFCLQQVALLNTLSRHPTRSEQRSPFGFAHVFCHLNPSCSSPKSSAVAPTVAWIGSVKSTEAHKRHPYSRNQDRTAGSATRASQQSAYLLQVSTVRQCSAPSQFLTQSPFHLLQPPVSQAAWSTASSRQNQSADPHSFPLTCSQMIHQRFDCKMQYLLSRSLKQAGVMLLLLALQDWEQPGECTEHMQ